LERENITGAAQDTLLAHLKTDYTQADLPTADRAILDYAMKLTVTPANMTAADVENLRQVGFNDKAIHDICAVTAYFAFVNRIADGLGVEVEPMNN
jgi:uncharacterized peroxidase-related enzyme